MQSGQQLQEASEGMKEQISLLQFEKNSLAQELKEKSEKLQSFISQT